MVAAIDMTTRRGHGAGRVNGPAAYTRSRLGALTVILAAMVICPTLAPGAFNSGSSGADGALDFTGTTSGTTVVLNPATMNPVRDADADNVFHFTTVTIPAGVTVRLRAPEHRWAPVEWLASGAVTINGTLSLEGGTGVQPVDGNSPTFSIPGPGGYPGGFGGTSQYNPSNGYGPRGGGAGNWGGGGAHDGYYGNTFLMPLTGGSGGGAGFFANGKVGGGGGAGGGAILIASSASITVNGTINAQGGKGALGAGANGGDYTGGSGAGGGVRLMAPTVAGSGVIDARGGAAVMNRAAGGGDGRVRVEANTYSFTGQVRAGTYRRVNLPPNPITGAGKGPRVRVTTVNGQPLAANPTGSYQVPDLTLSTNAAVTFNIEARFVPLGQKVTLYIHNESTLLTTVQSTALAGTEALSTATATTTIPHGYSLLWVRAAW